MITKRYDYDTELGDNDMIKTTLCYIKHGKQYLMLRRDKKLNDPNEGKWIGVGGKFERNETPEECMLREVFEETGITLDNYHYHGIIEFRSKAFDDEDMYLFTAILPKNYNANDISTCNEGTLAWIHEDDIMTLNLWEGDKIFLKKIIEHESSINMRLEYDVDGRLIE